MDDGNMLILGATLEKVAIIGAGITLMVLGFKLFKQTTEKQGEASIAMGQALNLNLKNLAPGVFFAAFGTALLLVATLHLGFTYTTNPNSQTVEGVTARPPTTPAKSSSSAAKMGPEALANISSDSTQAPASDTLVATNSDQPSHTVTIQMYDKTLNHKPKVLVDGHEISIPSDAVKANLSKASQIVRQNALRTLKPLQKP